MLYSLFTDKTPTYPKPYCLSDLNQMLTKSFQTMEVYTYIYKKKNTKHVLILRNAIDI